MDISSYIAITPAAFVVLAVGGMLIFCVSRRSAIPLILGLSIFLSMRQHVVVWGLNFMVHRIVLCMAWGRVIVRGEVRKLRLGAVDYLMISLFLWEVLSYLMVHQTVGAFINRMGRLFDGLGYYLLFRHLIKDWEDFLSVSRSLAWLCSVLAVLMLIEFVTGKNPLSIVGGVRAIVQQRSGIPRCQAAFGHPITAGTFGATLFPLFVMLLWGSRGRLRRAGIVGCVAGSVVTICSGSSGPVATYLGATGALCLWPLRHRMILVRWLVIISLVILQLLMNAPVWALIWRIEVFPGSTAYHRYRLINEFIQRFGEWWLFGVRSTDHWGFYMFDITNQYVGRGITGGLASLLMFVAIIASGFREIGRGIRDMSERMADSKLVWGVGSMLFAHCLAFMGVAYWDQIVVLWFLVLALIAVVRSRRCDLTVSDTVQPEDDSGKTELLAGENESFGVSNIYMAYRKSGRRRNASLWRMLVISSQKVAQHAKRRVACELL